MLRNFIIPFLTICVFLAAGSTGEAFVPQTPHLLHLVNQKIRVPAGLVVHQTREIPSDDASETIEHRQVKEILTYQFPGNLRSEMTGHAGSGFFAESNGRFVRVSNGQITAKTVTAAEFYAQLLLYRGHEAMGKLLEKNGVDSGTVTYQRLEGTICYFVGRPATGEAESSGLWIEKETFFPIRYQVMLDNRRLDIRYADWQRVSRTWYPMETKIFVNGQLFSHIKATTIELASGIAADLFNIDRIVNQYPVRTISSGSSGTVSGSQTSTPGVDGLGTEIDDFSKLYD